MDPTQDTTLVSRDEQPPPPPPRPPGPDTRIGHYVLEGELGRGGMGIVHRARDMALGRPVALKMILDARSAGPAILARFRREATATAKLRHPGIVTVFDVGDHEGRPYVVLELIEGESLAAMIARGALEPRRAAEIARGVARALAHAHENGVIHRDVKPG
ncbi:MAG: serine/threonine-protein kinase, partial [Planctomycetota bacterium]